MTSSMSGSFLHYEGGCLFSKRLQSGLRPADAATAVPRRCVRTIPARCKIVLNGTDDNDTWHEISRMKRMTDFSVSHRMQGVSDPTPESSGVPYQIMRDTARATFLVKTRLCSSARQLEALEGRDERLSERDFRVPPPIRRSRRRSPALRETYRKRSRVSVENEDAADGVEMKAVCSALDGHDPGSVRYGRLSTTGDRKPALRHAAMFHESCA